MTDGRRPTGITCPRCGCADLRTRNTKRLPGGRVRRYKRCRHCGKVTTTIETRAAWGRPTG